MRGALWGLGNRAACAVAACDAAEQPSIACSVRQVDASVVAGVGACCRGSYEIRGVSLGWGEGLVNGVPGGLHEKEEGRSIMVAEPVGGMEDQGREVV